MLKDRGRMGKRLAAKLPVQVAKVDESDIYEVTFTENYSAVGARVVTGMPWRVDDRLLIRSLAGDLRSQARVVYCHPLIDGRFGLGLELQNPAGSWNSDWPGHGG